MVAFWHRNYKYMQRPNIPYNRAPKICEIIDHLKYMIEQKMLFDDDIIIGIINHTTKREIDDKEQDYNYQEILIRRRDKPFVIPQCSNDDLKKVEEYKKYINGLCCKCYVKEMINQLLTLNQNSSIDVGIGNPQMVDYSTHLVNLGLDTVENTLHLMVFPRFPGSKDIREYIGNEKVFNYTTGEEITDENKKKEIINEFREQYK